MKDQVVERATTAIATGAIASPLWLPHLERALSIGVSALGFIWLLVQIAHKLKHWK
ncbi:hypothetical protein KQ944_07795 [Bacillus subtilis]|uniref:hypothetical protein n=1 Tax=Pseudochrobactrum asaccharolyticum TaxID=354351 RepID=UPI001F2F22D7|nr:hypothetical protein [Pseudochrobactrum asaccharolyticum]MCF7645048.1 hypothetical protein [Pseudochrobactrum asaccharolyticum]MCF7671525.1 hypothetical protein [Bacillus subtilis]